MGPQRSFHADTPTAEPETSAVQIDVGLWVAARDEPLIDEVVVEVRQAIMRSVNPYGLWRATIPEIRAKLASEGLAFERGRADRNARYEPLEAQVEEDGWQERVQRLLAEVPEGRWVTCGGLARGAGVPPSAVPAAKRVSEMLAREFRSRPKGIWAEGQARVPHLVGLHRILGDEGQLGEAQRRMPDYEMRPDPVHDVSVMLDPLEHDEGRYTGVAVISLNLGVPVHRAQPAQLERFISASRQFMTSRDRRWDLTGARFVEVLEVS